MKLICPEKVFICEETLYMNSTIKEWSMLPGHIVFTTPILHNPSWETVVEIRNGGSFITRGARIKIK